MATKTFLRAMTALIVSFLFSISVQAQTYLPLANNIADPVELADLIQQSLDADSTGNTKVEKANTSPNGYLQSVNAAGADVKNRQDLPAYVRNLKVAPAPKGKWRLSRADTHGNVDIKVGRSREALPGEDVWYDLNTGRGILMEGCTNSPLDEMFIKQPVPEIAWRPKTPVSRGASQCDRITTIRVYPEPAVNVTGVRAKLMDENCTSPYQRPEGSNGETDGDGSEQDRISRSDGPTFASLRASGELGLSSSPRDVVVTIVRGDQEAVLFEGPITGEQTLRLPEYFSPGDTLIVRPKNSSEFLSPSCTGVIVDYEEFEFPCGRNIVSMIES